MTKKEYADYENRVKKGLEGLSFVSSGICSSCSECQEKYGYCCEHSLAYALDNGSLCDEGYCSSSGCDCCGSSMQQILYDAHGRDCNARIVHLAICGDCLYYINYGRLDGTTMDEMGK